MSPFETALATQEETLRRSALPEVMLAEDVALVRRINLPSARRAIRRGECGPFVRLGRRLAVRREAFLGALEARESLRGGRR